MTTEHDPQTATVVAEANVRIAELKTKRAELWSDAMKLSIFILAMAAIPIAICGCGFVTEGTPLAESSSNSGDIPPRAPLLTTSPETTSTTSNSDAPSESSGVPDETTAEASTDTSGEESSVGLTSESSSDGGSTGPDPYAHTHCGETCYSGEEHESIDGAACVCAEGCGSDDECMAGETCNPLGACAVLCESDNDCPDGMLCAPWSKFYDVCMWAMP